MIRMGLGLLAATCAAPAAVAVMFGSLYLLQVGWFAGQRVDAFLDNTRLYAMMSAPVALFITLAFGSPISHRMAHDEKRSWWRHGLTGLALGAAPFLLFDGYNIGTRLLLDAHPAPDMEAVYRMGRWATLGAWCGLCSATAFWFVVIRRRVVRRG